MSKQTLGLGLLLLAGCKGGLLEDQGNDFPCDFSQPEGVRDSVCAPGEVCGVDNVCRQYRYEGPQFEGSATHGAPLPDFSSFTSLHPGVLNQPVVAVTHSGNRGVDEGGLIMGTPGNFEAAGLILGLDDDVTVAPFAFDPSLVRSYALTDTFAAVITEDRTLVLDPRFGGDQSNSVRTGMGVLTEVHNCDRLRTGPNIVLMLRSPSLLGNDTAGEFGADGIFHELTGVDAGYRPLEARYVPASGLGGTPELLMLSEQGFLLRRHSNDTVDVTTPGTDFPTDLTFSKPTLRDDVTGSIWAFTRTQLGVWLALSTWRLDRSGTSGIARLWNDCSPCRGGRIVAFAPLLDGAPEVQVLCATPTNLVNLNAGESLSLTRVVGSAAIDETEECLVEPAEAPFSLAAVNELTRDGGFGGHPELVQDDAIGAGVVLGGVAGQVWTGPSFTEALPLFLERTPLAFGTLTRPAPDGGEFVTPVALTDRYLAVPRRPDAGFQVVDIHRATNVALAEDVVVAALVDQGQGWGVLTSGDLAQIAPVEDADGGHLGLSFGPRLVDARGTAALSPFFAAAALDGLGNPISFLITANDSVYFTPLPATTATQDVLPQLTAQLTPAAGAPILSMALEGSPVGTDGINKMRGYLIAGRQLFIFTLAGTPPRWLATPIDLEAGEPVEVWMDNPLGGLGRVGYRNGEVFTLPGGFPLVNALPHTDGGQAPEVLDYATLGGWPVAMTSDGLFEAHWNENDAGRLLNRFPDGGPGLPMDWRLVTLPDGSSPWTGKKARLQVIEDTHSAYPRTFNLLVYTDDAVLQVGRVTVVK